MARYDSLNRLLQTLDVQGAGHLHDRGHVVERTIRFELVEEPKSLLGERKRDRRFRGFAQSLRQQGALRIAGLFRRWIQHNTHEGSRSIQTTDTAFTVRFWSRKRAVFANGRTSTVSPLCRGETGK